MSLYDFFWPEQAQATHLRTLCEQNARAMRERRREKSRDTNALADLRRENEQLRNDMGILALTVASLMRAIEKKGLLTNEEIKATINDVDLMDTVKDGKLDIDVLRNFPQ